MKRFAFIIVAACIQVGCGSDCEVAYGDLDGRDPVAEAADAARSRDPQAMAVAGFAVETPGLPGDAHCWLDANMAQIIPGTTDVVCSRDHEQFQIEAKQFAESFNAQLFRESFKFQSHACGGGAQQAHARDVRNARA